MTDPVYVAARSVLLDAFGALESHLGALVLVGAQAVYLRAGEGELAVAPYTTDGDIAIDPSLLGREPELAKAMADAQFHVSGDVGRWLADRTIDGTRYRVPVDLLVPAAVGGPGRRGARLEGHDAHASRKVSGLEACLVDNDPMEIGALADSDPRTFTVRVAGAGGLFAAKIHKIAERSGTPDRLRDKDALDIYRLLRATPANEVVARLRRCVEDPVARDTTSRALEHATSLFATSDSAGSLMAGRAAGGNAEVALATSVLVMEPLRSVRPDPR